jgi:serine protease AprX
MTNSRKPISFAICPLCGESSDFTLRDFHRTSEAELIDLLARKHPGWRGSMGACPSCVDRARSELARGDEVLVRNVPLLRVGGYLVPPTPLRMGADRLVTGKGVTIGFVDSGFSLHPDLCLPTPRIRGYHDVEDRSASVADLAAPDMLSWHGTMTSVGAAGSGFLSHGVYRGIASGAEVVLVRVSNEKGRQPDRNICAGLDWLLEQRERLALRIVNISLKGDAPPAGGGGVVERRIRALVEAGVVVIAASGNEFSPMLHPPASCPEAITVGGLDDGRVGSGAAELYHSNWDGRPGALQKPEVVAPALFVASPILPGTEILRQSRWIASGLLAEARDRRRIVRRHGPLLGIPPETLAAGGRALVSFLEEKARANKIIAPYYHHADGTSVAAPIVASVAAQMLEVAPFLSPAEVRELLIASARPVEGGAPLRQGWGVVSAGRAVALARQVALAAGWGADPRGRKNG